MPRTTARLVTLVSSCRIRVARSARCRPRLGSKRVTTGSGHGGDHCLGILFYPFKRKNLVKADTELRDPPLGRRYELALLHDQCDSREPKIRRAVAAAAEKRRRVRGQVRELPVVRVIHRRACRPRGAGRDLVPLAPYLVHLLHGRVVTPRQPPRLSVQCSGREVCRGGRRRRAGRHRGIRIACGIERDDAIADAELGVRYAGIHHRGIRR